MAENQDPFDSIIPNCHCSSSQKDLFSLLKFARQDETFTDDGENKSPATKVSGEKLDGSDDATASRYHDSGEFVAVCADCEENEKLGFSGERKRGANAIEVVFDGEVRVSPIKGGSDEPLVKKSRVLGFDSPNLKGVRVDKSPLVHCSEKMVIDDSDDNNRKHTVVFRSDVRVEIVSPVSCFVSDGGVQFNEKENLAKKKLEFEKEEEKGNKNGEIEAKDDEHEGVERQGKTKRDLPRTLVEPVWGTSAYEGERAGKGVSGIGTSREDGVNVGRGEGSKFVKPKADETLKHFVDVLRMLASVSGNDDDGGGEVDILETVKRRGMTFPQSRFLSRTEDE